MSLFEKIVTYISYLKQPAKRRMIQLAETFEGHVGIEVGGPSPFFSFKSAFPIYLYAKKIDGVNFSNNTLWEGKIDEGIFYTYYKNKKGFQFIGEAAELKAVKDASYDFVLSCHSLEHVANPIKALYEWSRVMKSKGRLVLVLPDKEFTFDNKRPVTTLAHLIEDYKNNTTEEDSTHFEEVISLHDFKHDAFVQSKEDLIKRTKLNIENRAVHHHVFDLKLINELLVYCGFEIIHQQTYQPFHLVSVAQKK
jgi:ubiquinone/menaquinone biosynthesis C-methylase UbiE